MKEEKTHDSHLSTIHINIYPRFGIDIVDCDVLDSTEARAFELRESSQTPTTDLIRSRHSQRRSTTQEGDIGPQSSAYVSLSRYLLTLICIRWCAFELEYVA